MCLLQGILVYIHEDGSLLLLTGGKQPEGLVHQQVLQAVVCEACKARLITDSLQEGQGTPRPQTPDLRGLGYYSSLGISQHLHTLAGPISLSWLLGLHLCTHYIIWPCCALGFRDVKGAEPYRHSVMPMPRCHGQCPSGRFPSILCRPIGCWVSPPAQGPFLYQVLLSWEA